MPIDRRAALFGGAALGFSARAASRTLPPAPPGRPRAPAWPEPVETIDLWPAGAPGQPAILPVEEVRERSTDPAIKDRALLGVTRPRLALFRPARSNGAAVLIIPGGGYSWVVIDKEGYELGDWLAARGVTCFVLFYRLPHQGWTAGADVALSDAQRAMRVIRARAVGDGVDPARVAAMGFSAGGHVCADLATRFDTRTYDAVDAADALSARPMLAAPIYPVISMSAPLAHPGSRRNLIGADATPERERAHAPHLNVGPDCPPSFIVHAEDDETVPVGNALLLAAALREKGVSVETHLFAEGGHGFGLRRAQGKPAAVWPELFLAWARAHGLFG